MKVESVLSEEGIAKASRNRTIFNRAILLLMRDNGLTREDVLNWLQNDEDPAWLPEAEKHPFTD